MGTNLYNTKNYKCCLFILSQFIPILLELKYAYRVRIKSYVFTTLKMSSVHTYLLKKKEFLGGGSGLMHNIYFVYVLTSQESLDYC